MKKQKEKETKRKVAIAIAIQQIFFSLPNSYSITHKSCHSNDDKL